ncbi:hypothetical protein RND81_02G102900 [Saponaria officinalis]|uniref:Uncharacterized protein n=1 Tax=Saponaria officinalis TaxID=3572 RepID=A0AAW1MNZ9_SAPOF
MELRFKSEAFHNGKNKPDNMTWQIYLNPKLSRKLCANLEPELSQSNLEISKTGSLKSSSTTQIFDSKVHVQQKTGKMRRIWMVSREEGRYNRDKTEALDENMDQVTEVEAEQVN